MNRDVVRQIVNVVMTLFVIGFNAWSQALPLNGQTSAMIANSRPSYFFPANYVFSIWGVIYIGLIAFAIYQALPAQRDNPRLRRIGYWFAFSSIANVTWLTMFHFNQYELSMIAMVALLASLVVIYLRLRTPGAPVSTLETWAVRVPFSIYFGWITVATVANASFVLYNPDQLLLGIADSTWGAIMLVVSAVIAGYVSFRYRDIAYAAVIIWAFVGIIARWPEVNLIAVTAGLMAAAVGVAALISLRARPSAAPLRAA